MMHPTARIHRLEQRLAVVDDPVVRRRIEHRLRMLRLPPKSRIQVLEKRLSKQPHNQQLRARLERLRCASDHNETKGKKEAKPAAERIRIIQSKLELPDAPNRDRLKARLTLLQLQSQPKNHGNRVKRLQARLVLNPNQPELCARLERLVRQNREDLEEKLHKIVARDALKRRPLIARVKALEEQLERAETAEERSDLEVRLDNLHQKLSRRRDAKEAASRAPQTHHTKLMKRVQTLEGKLNKMDNAEERMELEAKLDRVRNKIWRLESKDGRGIEKTVIKEDLAG